MNSYLRGCCIAKITSRRRHLCGLETIWPAVQCCQHFYKLLHVNGDVFDAKGYGHIWASSGYRLKWEFCGCLNDVDARAYVRSCVRAFVRSCVRTCVRAYVRAYVLTCVRAYVRTCVRAYVGTWVRLATPLGGSRLTRWQSRVLERTRRKGKGNYIHYRWQN